MGADQGGVVQEVDLRRGGHVTVHDGSAPSGDNAGLCLEAVPGMSPVTELFVLSNVQCLL